MTKESMSKFTHQVASFIGRYPALLVGLLAGGALISAFEKSLVPAVLQALCALAVACTVKWKSI